MKSPRTPQHLSGTPRIYVASLSDYNAGHLHGRWIDADQDPDAIREEIAAMPFVHHERPCSGRTRSGAVGAVLCDLVEVRVAPAQQLRCGGE